MNPEQHKKRHEELHKCLDELVADFILHSEKRPSETSVMELMQWSHNQTINPSQEKTQD